MQLRCTKKVPIFWATLLSLELMQSASSLCSMHRLQFVFHARSANLHIHPFLSSLASSCSFIGRISLPQLNSFSHDSCINQSIAQAYLLFSAIVSSSMVQSRIDNEQHRRRRWGRGHVLPKIREKIFAGNYVNSGIFRAKIM